MATPKSVCNADALESTSEVPERPGASGASDPRILQAIEQYAAALNEGRAPARELADDEAQSGETLGDFRIVREVGRGGMGVVYEATQISLNRRVALKILPFAATLDAKHLQRFKKEAQAAACLHHTNIVPVYAVGFDRGVHFYAMQFIDGRTLAEVIAELKEHDKVQFPGTKTQESTEDRAASAPASQAETASGRVLSCDLLSPSGVRHVSFFRSVARLGVQAAEALEQAHQVGVVHRDIKPANLLVDGCGQLWVADFGLAQVQTDDRLTWTGDVVGTLRYMSPEQALGKRVVLDQRTDIYSLGATLYELATLQPAVPGTDREELLRQIAFGEPAALRRLNPAVPRELETIILKALAKEPGRRYGSARELADDLRRFLNGEPIRARPITAWGRAWKWARRRPVVAALMLLSGLALMSLLIGAIWHSAQIQEYNRDLKLAVEEERRLKGVAQERERLVRRHLYAGDLRQIQSLYEKKQGRMLMEMLNRHRPQPDQEDLRGFEWYYWRRLVGRDFFCLRHEPAVEAVAFSPDGRLVASAGADPTIKIWNAVTGQLWKHLEGHRSLVQQVVFSPDGKTLASGAEDRLVKLWDVASGTERATLDGHLLRARCLAFSPNGNMLASGGDPCRIFLWDVSNGTSPGVIRDDSEEPEHPALVFLAGGKLLATGDNLKAVKLWDVAEKKLWKTLPPARFPVTGIALSADGATLACADLFGLARLWNTSTWQLRGQVGCAGKNLRLNALALGPSFLAAAGSWDEPTPRSGWVRLFDLATQKPIVFRDEEEIVNALAVAPDGHTLAFGGGEGVVKLWQPNPVKEPPVPAGHTEEAWGVAFYPNGHLLATAADDHTVKVWDLASGQNRFTLKDHISLVADVACDPQGRYLASASYDSKVKLWDAETGALLATLIGHKDKVRRVAFSPDGKLLATASRDGTVRLWDVPTRTERRVLSGHKQYSHIRGLAFSPDGATLASGSEDKTIRLWQVSTGEPLQVLKADVQVWSLAFSPDGRLLATGNKIGAIRLWELASGTDLLALTGHGGGIDTLAFSPDGKTLASGSQDKTVRLWQTATGQELAVFRNPTAEVNRLAFSADGLTLAAVCHDGSIKLWHGARDEEISPAAAQP